MIDSGPPLSETGISEVELGVSNKPLKKETNTPNTSFPLYDSFYRGAQRDSFLTSEELVIQTDRFMHRFGEMIEKHELPDTIFFLDKSARPVAYMFRKLFPVYFPEAGIPEIRFVNIGGSGSRLYDTDARPFTGNPDIIRQTYGEHINQQGRIAIVDEYTHTGQASKHATEVIGKAFPQATVTTMVAYDKLPNWYQNEDYLGVTEYTDTDYQRIALQKLNEDLGTNYDDLYLFNLGRNEMFDIKAKPGVDYEHIPDKVKTRFYQIREEIEGTLPYVKKGKHIQTHYEYPKPTLAQKLKRENPAPVEVKTNVFKEAREELDRFCQEIVKQKDKRQGT